MKGDRGTVIASLASLWLVLESQPCWFPCKIILRLPPFSLGFGSRHVLYESSPKLECAEKCAQGRGPL